MTDKDFKIGTIATCESCDGEIKYTGPYWEHVICVPIHYATPKEQMRKDGNKPNCCDLGSKYISWHIIPQNGFEVFRGWGIATRFRDGDESTLVHLSIQPVFYCLFCGEKLDKENVKNDT